MNIPDKAVTAAASAFIDAGSLVNALHAAAPYIAAVALREAAADASVRGDIGKDGGVEAWRYLGARADRILEAIPPVVPGRGLCYVRHEVAPGAHMDIPHTHEDSK